MTAPNRLAIDIYSGNTVVDFAAVYAAGIRLVIHKASEGITIVDRKYAERRQQAKDAGLLWGAYHFGRGSDVDAQVANFLSVVNPDPETRLVLDWEVPDMTPEMARRFVQEVDVRNPQPTILYSYVSFLTEQLGQKIDPILGARPLWLAAYRKTPPIPQPSWATWLLWQYTDGQVGGDPKGVPGITGDVDCNAFDGTEAELRAAWLGHKIDSGDTTLPETTAAELVAGVAAATAVLDANLPRWARGMISDGQIQSLVAAIVDAVDRVRDGQPKESSNEHS